MTEFATTCITPYNGAVDEVWSFNKAPDVIVVDVPPSNSNPLPVVSPAASTCTIVPPVTPSAVINTGFVAWVEVVSKCNRCPDVNAVLPVNSNAVPDANP